MINLEGNHLVRGKTSQMKLTGPHLPVHLILKQIQVHPKIRNKHKKRSSLNKEKKEDRGKSEAYFILNISIFHVQILGSSSCLFFGLCPKWVWHCTWPILTFFLKIHLVSTNLLHLSYAPFSSFLAACNKSQMAALSTAFKIIALATIHQKQMTAITTEADTYFYCHEVVSCNVLPPFKSSACVDFI